MGNAGSKRCRDCGKVETPQGGRCAECGRAAAKERRERQRREDPDYWKRFYAQNRERRLAASIAYGREHAEEKAEKSREWYARNRERANAAKRAYRAANPEYRRKWTDWINWRKRGENAPDDEALAYSDILRGDPCAYCGEPTAEIDHIEPMIAGGQNAWSNLTASCRKCNRSKAAKPLLTFLLER